MKNNDIFKTFFKKNERSMKTFTELRALVAAECIKKKTKVSMATKVRG